MAYGLGALIRIGFWDIFSTVILIRSPQYSIGNLFRALCKFKVRGVSFECRLGCRVSKGFSPAVFCVAALRASIC